MKPTIIEVAINGSTRKSANPTVPETPEEIAAEALRCLNAGAAIIHNHIEDIRLVHDAAASRYSEGWAAILAERPDAILSPTVALADTAAEKASHLEGCARLGARMGSLDPGSVSLASTGVDGGPGAVRYDYINGFDELDVTIDALARNRLGPSIAIYDPSFLRATLAYHRAGRLPAGAMVKLYFGGEYDLLADRNGPSGMPAVSFGFPPTRAALEAYLEMLAGSGLEWSVAVLGGDAVGSGIVRLALERGGHIRIGLEDYRGERKPSNLDLLDAALAECRKVGRSVATCGEAAEILGLPEKLNAPAAD